MNVRKSYCTTPSIGISSGGSISIIKFYAKDLYVIGKVLSGKLSCTVTSLVHAWLNTAILIFTHGV